MDKTFQEPRIVSRSQNFVFFTAYAQRAEQLGRCLDGLGRVDRLTGDAAYITRSAVILKPTLVFVDFAPSPPAGATANPASNAPMAPDAVAQTLQRCLPDAVLIGVGDMRDPSMTLMALRSGVSDFVDLDGAPDSVRSVVTRLTERLNASSRRALTVAITGARVGMGTSTLAAHLVTMLAGGDGQRNLRVALLDLGLPVGDGLLYTNTQAGFDFADAVSALSRLDETLVRTALPVSPQGVSVLALPGDLGRMRTLPQADAVTLVDQIRKYFDLLVVDLGGAGSHDLTASVLTLADVRLVLTDQGIASVISLSDLLSELDERSVERSSLRLIVNRYEESYGMSAAQLSERFKVPLSGHIPDRRMALGRAAALGELLSASKQDPYTRAVQKLIDTVVLRENDHQKAGATSSHGTWSNVTRLWKRG